MRKSLLPILLILVMLCLSGCWSQSTVVPQPTPVTRVQFFEGQVDLGDMQWMEGQADERGVTLGVCGISALSEDVAFIFGDVNGSAGTLRSILLRTGDGGNHWVEVMNPVVGSSVRHVAFVDGGEGWALVMWTVEGPGLVSLYHTTDYGLTWDQLSEVPKWAWYGVPVKMHFTDNNHGQIDMVYDLELPPKNRIAYLTTMDGGLNWQETGSYVPGNGSQGAVVTAAATYSERSTSDAYESTGLDKSQWKAARSRKTTQMTISRRLITENDWTVVSIIPTGLKYSGGHLTLP